MAAEHLCNISLRPTVKRQRAAVRQNGDLMIKFRFPEGFLFGTGSSAFQIEGSPARATTASEPMRNTCTGYINFGSRRLIQRVE